MRIDLEGSQVPTSLQERNVEIGSVWRNTRGSLLIVVGLSESGETTFLLVADPLTGEITGCQRYGAYYVRRLRYYGQAVNLPDAIEIEWAEAAP